MAKSTFKMSGSEEAIEVGLERRSDGREGSYLLRVGDSSVEIDVDSIDAGEGLIRMRGKTHRFLADRRDGKIEVWLDGRTYSFEALETGARRTARDEATAGPAGNAITAPMPGTVLKILVKPGESVTAHQAIVVMESMKMEMTLAAPREGSVKEILCGENELVEMGRVLVKLEPIANG
jgi:3-methylcrotonyl-CoA carboxylase alpha subunit